MPARVGLVFVSLLYQSFSFNLDTNHAQVLVDPQGDAESYFGYSLFFYKDSLLVGAPKGINEFDPNSTRSGVAYNCNAAERICSQIQLTNKTAEREENLRVVDGWIGNVISGHESRGVLVCGGRLQEIYPTEYASNGGCYWKKNITSDENSKLLVPMSDGNQQTINKNGTRYFYYQHGQAGFSALMTKDGNSIVLGTPGFGTGVGSLIQYQYDAGSKDFIEIPPESENSITQNGLYQYLGYAVASGNFFNGKEAFVGGAPRADRGKGRIILMIASSSSDVWDKLRHVTGESMGDGYGSSLATADINGDGFDDLLVGAPRAGELDTGRVYVYLGSSTELNLENPKKIEGFKEWSQFGNTVAGIGDINKDGCEDFAVGVPFDGDGVVYIYLGNKTNGFRAKFVQRIAAADLGGLSSTPRGFGISLAGGKDIDGNGVTDVAVGSYESGHVVLLRARPTLILEPFFPDELPLVPVSASSIDLRVCLSYKGTLEEPADALITVEDDARAIVNLNSSIKEACVVVKWIIKERGFFGNFYLTAKASLVNGNNTTEFCKHCPVADPESPVATTVVYFASNCRNSSACFGDISVTAEFLNVSGPVTISPNTLVSIRVSVKSAKDSDPAYMVSLNMMFSSKNVKVREPRLCQSNNDIFECPVTSILDAGNEVTLVVELDISDIFAGTDLLVVNITANGGLKDDNLINNVWTKELHLNSKADATIIGDSDKPYIDFNEMEVNITKTMSAEHIFEIQNKGPALIEGVTVLFSIPSEIKFKDKYRRIISIEKPVFVDLTCTHISGPNFTIDIPEVINDIAEAIPQDVKGQMKAFCNADNVTCTVVKCNSSKIRTDKQIKTTFKLLFDRHVLAEILSVYDLEVISKAELIGLDGIQAANILPDFATCSTVLIGPLPKPFIAAWIWVLPTLCGLLIVGILVFVLYKCNFFKRKKFPPVNEGEEEVAFNTSET